MSFKPFHIVILITFIVSVVIPTPNAHADSLLGLPEPGVMVNLSPAFEPMLIKGLKVHPDNPFLFDFIIDSGNAPSTEQSSRLIKYFLAALTVPEKDLWVNLSPYEKNRMIAVNLAQTDMGRDMLAQDYMLKQLTASLIYPEKDLGRTFWNEVYRKARERFNTTQIPVTTFNKVWIIPDKADVYEHGDTAYIIGAHLKVMLEEDYLALDKNSPQTGPSRSIASQVIRQIILPLIEHEVNEGENFASLRQMFYSMILASWYKIALKDAILTQIYGNQSKVKVGINQADPGVNQEIFNRYLRAYKKGVFNFIKEDVEVSGEQAVPRKYFSGGTSFAILAQGGLKRYHDPAMIPVGDLIPEDRRLWDAAITVRPAQQGVLNQDNAMVARTAKNKIETRTIVWFSKEGNGKGLVAKSDLMRYEGTGSPLDTLNNNVWQQYSDQYVVLQPKLKIDDRAIQNIAGVDYERVSKILAYAQQGIPELRYTRVHALRVDAEEADVFLKAIKDNKDIVMMSEAEIKRYTRDGNVTFEKFSGMNRKVPEKYIGKKIVLPENVKELLNDFQPDREDALKSIKDATEVGIKVNDVFVIKIFDKKSGRYMHVLAFNHSDMQNGKLKLSLIGGGTKFLSGGFEYYKKNVDPTLRMLPREPDGDVRVIVQVKNMGRMLKELDQGNYIETNGNRELIEELDGETGIFRWNVDRARFNGINFAGTKWGPGSAKSIWVNMSPTEVQLKAGVKITKRALEKDLSPQDVERFWPIVSNEMNRPLIPAHFFEPDAAMISQERPFDQPMRISDGSFGTKISFNIPNALLTNPTAMALVQELKFKSNDFAMINRGSFSELTFIIKTAIWDFNYFKEYFPWQRYASNLLKTAPIVLIPPALYYFHNQTEIFLTVIAVVLDALILQYLKDEGQEKIFLENNKYFQNSVINTFYENGFFTNGHSWKQLDAFYALNFQIFKESFDDHQEEEYLERIVGTMPDDEVKRLKSKLIRTDYENRKLIALNERENKKIKFLREHQDYMKMSDEDFKEKIVFAYNFYHQNDAPFKEFLGSEKEREVVVLKFVENLTRWQAKKFLPEIREQKSLIQQKLYLYALDKALKPDNKVPNSDTAMLAALQPKDGGIDFNASLMRLGVYHDGGQGEILVDRATIARIKSQGFDGLEFHIQSIVPYTSSI